MKLVSNKKFVIISLFVIAFIAYFQTLWMYFWIDDNALIYKLQHINTYSGYWGSGIFGEGPYRHIVDQFVLFYPLFKTNPALYYAVGIILYFLASVTIYFFIKTLTKNIYLAWGSAVIFAAGFVGSESIFGITNSWQTSRGIIMAIFTFWLFYRYIVTKKTVFYILSLLLFFFSLDTVYVRAHGLIFAILFFDLIFTPVKFGKMSMILFLVRQGPFIFIHYYVYLTSTALVRNFGILNFLQDVFLEKKYALLSVPFQNVGNLFVPDTITKLVDNFVVNNLRALPQGFSLGSTLSGLFFLALLAYFVVKWHKKESNLVKLLLFSSVWMIGNMVVFFTRETTLILQTTHRYLSYSFVGLSFFLPISFYLLSRQIDAKNLVKIFSALTLSVIIIYLYLGINFQYSFNQKRSIPTRNFFSSFDKSIPNIPKGAVIYFNVANDPQVKGEYNQFFGGMFSEAGNLAILSETINDYANDFLVTYDFNELSELLKNNKVSLDNTYSFYYGESGLVDTSQISRELLTNGRIVKIGDVFNAKTLFSESGGKTFGENPKIEISIPEGVPSLVPSTLSFSMSVSHKIPPLPYETRDSTFLIKSNDKNNIFSYLLSQSRFRKTAVATSASFWKEQEPRFAIDGRLETSWRGHRGFWDNIDRGITHDVEHLSVDVGRTLTVSQVRWVSAQRPLVPTHYKILTSLDGKLWDLVKEVADGKALPEETVVVDSFNPTPARFVKMEILATYGNDGPEIKEFEVIEANFANLDQKIVERVRKEPFGKIETLSDFNNALAFVRQNANLRFYYQSSADSKQDQTRYVDVPLVIDGRVHEYSIDLPATGLSWTQFTLSGFNFPAEIVIKNAKITYAPVLK